MDFTTPSGFRDILADEALERERIARDVQDLFAKNAYVPLETPTLESMNALQAGGRIPPSPFKFFDSKGDLVAMRPDVTLQVARMCATRLRDSDPHETLRFRYMQRVFRDSSKTQKAEVREKKQIGIECIGSSGAEIDAEVIGLFVQALELAGVRNFRLSLATVGVLGALLQQAQASDEWKNAVLEAFHQSNLVSLDALCAKAPEAAQMSAQAIQQLARVMGGQEAIDEVRALVAPLGLADTLSSLEEVYDALKQAGLSERIVIDFSVMSSFDYYTGVVFEAFADGLGSPLGGGGRYDSLLGLYGSHRPAAGFAFYLEEVMAAAALACEHNANAALEVAPKASSVVESTSMLEADPAHSLTQTSKFSPAPETAFASETPVFAGARLGERPLRIAVPKGSLNADTISALEEAGLDTTNLANPGRSLIIRNPGVEYIIVRPSDAPVFVELGAADCGICGEDSLMETSANVVELADLRFGACRFIVAQLEGTAEQVREHSRKLGSIRVATKYPNIARAHFARRGIQVEIVELHGNIELGPLTGMSECIVDITATGTTLRENNLVISDEVLSSTARFFANTASFRTDPRVRSLARKLRAQALSHELKVTAGGVG